jgi:AcrR family transcriptional regulator
MDAKAICARTLNELLKTKTIDSISVREIVENSDLGHSTFYNHFTDKYDLANWFHREVQRT